MAILLRTDGNHCIVHPANEAFSLKELCKNTNSRTIQILTLNEEVIIACDEEGWLNEKQVNIIATLIFKGAGGACPLVGNVLVCHSQEIT